jgi:hypothetical protein
VWREQALAEIRAREFSILRLEPEIGKAAADEIRRTLADARAAAGCERSGFRATLNGAAIERAWGLINTAEEAMLEVAPESYVRGQLPRLRRRAEVLPPNDERRKRIDAISELGQLTGEAREQLVTAFHAANCEARKSQGRVRSFNVVILGCAVLLAIVAVGLAVFGFAKPQLVPLCFTPESQVVCPTQVDAIWPGAQATGQPASAQTAQDKAEQDQRVRENVSSWDVALIELIGLIAASVAAAATLRRARGTSTPYSVPFALAMLKLPLGALTAVLGVLFMRGGFVPGLSALDTPAQILAWAILFGYAQQVFTRMVDTRGHDVLDAAGGHAKPG